MTKSKFIPILLVVFAGSAHGQAPDALTIQQALNEGVELEFPHFQAIADVVLTHGGQTADSDFLFLGTGRLRWKLSSEDLKAVLQQEIVEEVERRGGSQDLWVALNTALSVRMDRISPFQAGETATLVKFLVRLEQAGADWIVTGSKFKESDRNPLSILDQ